jgi:hypothetical protein
MKSSSVDVPPINTPDASIDPISGLDADRSSAYPFVLAAVPAGIRRTQAAPNRMEEKRR